MPASATVFYDSVTDLYLRSNRSVVSSCIAPDCAPALQTQQATTQFGQYGRRPRLDAVIAVAAAPPGHASSSVPGFDCNLAQSLVRGSHHDIKSDPRPRRFVLRIAVSEM